MPKETFVSGGNDWAPVKPNVTAAVSHKPSALRNFTGAMTLALGLALTLGATGCASVATAQAAEKTPIVQTQTRPAQQDSTKASASYQIGKGLHEIGKGTKEAARPALDKGKEVGKEIGKAGKEVGQEIGKAGKKFGLGVAKEAKSFWKGLTGKE
ncbi:MAG: hypothetical protein KF760_31615 [Candidatus Eremiobacteraeota bacterium]|nr:hypothetical protein [Candidatus Eremiobacteraeota bacterium]MCW5870034.1 hypothetical protein [Candidatus Eremiobacteraeota bacterium]